VAESVPTIRLLVLTPDRIVMDEPVTAIRFQTPDGWVGVLPNHAPFITQLVNGVMRYAQPESDQPHYLVLYGGTLHVKRDEITVLTAAAEKGDDLQELARHLLERQAEADALAFEAVIEFAKVRAALVRALVDLPPAPEAIR
jgi:F-type H+-transporting ATPase subunit epsilon